MITKSFALGAFMAAAADEEALDLPTLQPLHSSAFQTGAWQTPLQNLSTVQ
jgi:hypothetical protein